MEDALVSSTNLKRTKEYKEKYEEIKERLLNIRKDLTEKLKISTSFFKLCIRDEYSLYRNLSDLLEISENPTAEAYIGDNFKLFIKSPSCIDLAFKSCIALEIMEREGNVRRDMKKEIDFVKQINNTVSEGQLNQAHERIDYNHMSKRFNVLVSTCLRCSHQWVRRKPGKPTVCPGCHSKLWDKKRDEEV